jgi:predicted SAM-dependent methyltransferase
MRLNLGCGNRKFPGWVNTDKVAACNPDQVVDLESLPWPWPDDSVEEVMLSHVLEHLGQATDVYLGLIKELYRVCRDGAKITVIVPHPRHDHFLNDPTHVRAVTEEGLNMFSQASNRKLMALGAANTPLGVYMNVDFALQNVTYDLDDVWLGKAQRGEVTPAELQYAKATYSNVVTQTTIILRAIKPAGREV